MPLPTNIPSLFSIHARTNQVSVQSPADLKLHDHMECAKNLPIKVKHVFRFGEDTLEGLKVLFVADLQPGDEIKFLNKEPFTISLGPEAGAVAKFAYARVNGFDCVISWSDVTWYRFKPEDCPVNDDMEQLLCCDHEPRTFEHLLFDYTYRVISLVAVKRRVFDRMTGRPRMILKRDEYGTPVIDEDGHPVMENVFTIILKPFLKRL